jgi:chemotaxis methyl-accepting protein methylase
MNESVQSSTVFRPVHGTRIGTTAFFRNTAFLTTLASQLRDIERPRVLFHGCSNGAEPLSFAAVWCETDGRPIQIDATDIEPAFLELAPKLTHPRLTAMARSMVRFLPPSSVVSFVPEKPYDVVACMNVLCYLPPDDQRTAIGNMSRYANHYLCVTAADPHVVREAIEAAGFAPVSDNWFAIYYGWKERLSLRARQVWKLPYLPMVLPNWRFSGTSIFRRQAPGTAADRLAH